MAIEKKRPSQEELRALWVFTWPIWSCQPSSFDWSYSETETCYFLEGRVRIESPDGVVEAGAGDLMVFPEGLSCTWNVIEKVRKHYRFD
jgi:uncharacterized cupin superfamily protein